MTGTHRGLERKSIHSVKEVFAAVRAAAGAPNFVVDGDAISPDSKYALFLLAGTRCRHCGIRGVFFAKERWPGVSQWHLNLYGVDSETGAEVVMTKDHVVPRSLGGTASLSNLQPLCKPCNERKGSRLEALDGVPGC